MSLREPLVPLMAAILAFSRYASYLSVGHLQPYALYSRSQFMRDKANIQELRVSESQIKFAAQLVSKRTLIIRGSEKVFGVRFAKAEVVDGAVIFVFERWELELFQVPCENGVATHYETKDLPPRMRWGHAIAALTRVADKARLAHSRKDE
jgi:hypothetical protein